LTYYVIILLFTNNASLVTVHRICKEI